MKDRVAVVGAGPAGSVAALVLARAGVPVDLIDRASFPRDKACGDALLPRSVDELSLLGLDRLRLQGHAVAHWQVLTLDGDSLVRDDRHAHSTAWITRRHDFDAALRDAAVDAGARPIRARLDELDPSEDGGPLLSLADDEGTLRRERYRFVIGADGARSRVARSAALLAPIPTDRAVSIRRYVRFDRVVDPEVFVAWWARQDDAGPGYSWALPVDETWWNVGVYGCDPGAGRGMAAQLDRFLRRLEALLTSPVAERSPVLGSLVRYDFAPGRVSRPGIAVVGDAAGLTEAMTGEGIHHALMSGRIVAETIIDTGLDRRLEGRIAGRMAAAFAEPMRRQRLAAVARGPRPEGGRRLPAMDLGRPLGGFALVDGDGFRWSNRTTRGRWFILLDVDVIDVGTFSRLADFAHRRGPDSAEVLAVTTGESPTVASGFPPVGIAPVDPVADRTRRPAVGVVDPDGVVRLVVEGSPPTVRTNAASVLPDAFLRIVDLLSVPAAVSPSVPPTDPPGRARAVDATTRPSARATVDRCTTPEGTLIAGPRGGAVLRLSRLEVALWECCDGATSIAELADDLRATLGIERPDALARLIDAVTSWLGAGLVTTAPEQTVPAGFVEGSLNLDRSEPGRVVPLTGPFATDGRRVVLIDREVFDPTTSWARSWLGRFGCDVLPAPSGRVILESGSVRLSVHSPNGSGTVYDVAGVVTRGVADRLEVAVTLARHLDRSAGPRCETAVHLAGHLPASAVREADRLGGFVAVDRLLTGADRTRGPLSGVA